MARQDGFGVGGFILLCTAILLLAAGFFVVQRIRRGESIIPESAESAKNTVLPPPPQSVYIKEWGLRMKADPALGAVTYSYDESDDSIAFDSSLQQQLSDQCYAGDTAGPWGVIRYEDETRDGLKQVDNDFYRHYVPANPCDSSVSDDIARQTQLSQLYQSMFESLEIAP